MRLKDLFYAGLVGAFLATPLAQASYEAGYNFSKPKSNAQIKNEASQKPSLEELTEESPKLKSFANYEHFDQDDALIVPWVDFWNQEYKKFSHLPGYSPLEYNLVKSMMIEESGSSTHRETAFKYDPMQIANQNDPAFSVLKNGSESSLPKEGYAELKKKKPTPWKNKKLNYAALNDEERITAELSIKYGLRWLWQKAAKYDAQGQIYAFRPWSEAVKNYNGSHRKESYTAHVFNRLK